METLAEVKLYALKMLATREHSKWELKRKLCAKKIHRELIEAALGQLVDEGAQDDRRYAESYVRVRSMRGYGPVKIGRELEERGVEKTIITEKIMNANLDWNRLANSAHFKKFKSRPETIYERLRQTRFLQYRGFTFEQIRDALGGACDANS